MKTALGALPAAFSNSSSTSSSLSLNPQISSPATPLTQIQLLVDSISSILYGEPTTSLIDTDNLNACLAFAALYLLKDRGIFRKLDFTNQPFLDALHRRPPCRWELHKCSCSISAKKDTKTSNEGEYELRQVDVVLDVGHNPAAIEALVRRIKRDFDGRTLRILYGVSRDKDYRKCLRNILTLTSPDHIHFAQSSNFRALSTAELGAIFQEETGYEMLPLASSNIKDNVIEILQLAASESTNSVVVICGSGYLMPDAREAIGVIEPRDDYDLQN